LLLSSARQSGSLTPHPCLPMDVQAVSELTPRPVAWLWPAWLGSGKVALCDGDPDLGKSFLTLDLCARLSTGRPMPDGSPGPGICNSLVLNGEDNADDTLLPRLQALGADRTRVFVPRRQDGLMEWLRLPTDLGGLEQAIVRTQARLLVLDPVVAFLDATVMVASDASVRRALFPLAQLAQKRDCAIHMVRHLNKQVGGQALYRGGGSIGLLAACRAAWLLARAPQEPERGRVLAQVKNNLGPRQPSLAFRIEGGAGQPPSLTWLGPSPLTADDLVRAARAAPAEPRDRAGDFLKAFLQGGPRTTREIWPAAVKEGHTKRTLQRARKELSISSERRWEDNKWVTYWVPPTHELPLINDELEKLLTPLREQYPPPTPLDEEEDDL